MHQRSGNVSEALASMLDDSSSAGGQRSDQVFQFISELSQSLTGTGLVELHNVVLSELQRLVDLDRESAAPSFWTYFPMNMNESWSHAKTHGCNIATCKKLC